MRHLEKIIIALIVITALVLAAVLAVNTLYRPGPGDVHEDGIGGAPGRDPATASNRCGGPDATLDNLTIYRDVTLTCASRSPVTIYPGVFVNPGGTLEILAPKVQFLPGFKLPRGAALKVHATNSDK